MNKALRQAVHQLFAAFEAENPVCPVNGPWTVLVTGVIDTMLETCEMAPLHMKHDALVLWCVQRVLRTWTMPK